MNTIIAERPKGQVPISMGTALGVEGALGIHPDHPESQPPIRQYDAFWVNLRTLYRNLIMGFTADQQRSFTPEELLPALWEDALGLQAALRKDYPKLQVVVYHSAYEGLDKRFPNASLKVVRTPLQAQAQELETLTYKRWMKEPPDVAFASVKLFLPSVKEKTLILTHVTLDLLARYHFPQLDLLESNTGLIKKPAQWNTKLGVKEQADLLPFNTFTLQVYGDRGVLFQPQALSLRRQLLELAEQRHWSSITSLDRIRENLKTFAPPALRDALLPLSENVVV